MSLCLSPAPRAKEVRAPGSRAVTLADMVEAARKTIFRRGELHESDLELAGFTKAEIAEHRETVLARLRREARRLDA
ncbi:hypothetical protein [Chenggangzhangella methanolivorans]|uniref:Uncharacterized protein n=1 Tax=Chenggangzhangella methanolivorans TaxID=1437009 RepID=A0A9E6REM4_9HYPH|nr:hypothetical protein [Chenggangzhangella methanolivorans]QZN99511.1 hypothetical protein K6K41_22825 [Chenggangzhangella methanolivorans]